MDDVSPYQFFINAVLCRRFTYRRRIFPDPHVTGPYCYGNPGCLHHVNVIYAVTKTHAPAFQNAQLLIQPVNGGALIAPFRKQFQIPPPVPFPFLDQLRLPHQPLFCLIHPTPPPENADFVNTVYILF